MAQDSYERVGDVVKNFVDTVDFNLQKSESGAGRFERIVYSPEGIRRKDYEKFKAYINERCQALLEDIDNWIARLDLPTKGESEDVVHTGIGIYHYLESSDDTQSFKQKLEKEGLIKD